MLLPFDAAIDAAVWLQQLRIFLPEALERLNSVALNSHWLDKKVFANLLRAGCFSNIISRLHSVLTEIFGKKTPPAGTKKKQGRDTTFSWSCGVWELQGGLRDAGLGRGSSLMGEAGETLLRSHVQVGCFCRRHPAMAFFNLSAPKALTPPQGNRAY